ncbi:hypothetical protein BaRGS_00024297 [Batillaria attramentaria]|uniref:Uncharacterized protein n=1 Tax=Batillaria attramentaria TaxID=370345 RepID=A0ABD0KBJ6_9CAEN
MGGTTSSTSIVKFDVLRDRDTRECPEDPAASDPTTTDLNRLTTPLSFENEHYIGISPGHDGNRKKTKSCKEKPACRLTTEADNRIYVIVAALFVLLDVLLLTLFIVVLVLPENVQTTDDPEASTSSLSRKVALEDSAFCLPCSKVYLNKLEVEQNRFKVNVHNATASDSDDLGICCEEPLSDLKYFVQTMVSVQCLCSGHFHWYFV